MEGGFKNRVEESAMLMFKMRINFNGFWGQSKKYPDRYATSAGNMWWKEAWFKKLEVEENRMNYEDELLKTWEHFPINFITSSAKQTGLEEIKKFIGENNSQFKI